MSARGLIGVLGIFAGLCTVFALIVGMSDGWREHAQESWPQTTATIERCSLDPYVPLSVDLGEGIHGTCRIPLEATAQGSGKETQAGSKSNLSSLGSTLQARRKARWRSVQV